MSDKITLYQMVEKWLPYNKISYTTDSRFDRGGIAYHNILLSEIKQRLEKVEISKENLFKLIRNSEGNLMGEKMGYLCGELYLKDLAQAILAHLENLGKEIK